MYSRMDMSCGRTIWYSSGVAACEFAALSRLVQSSRFRASFSCASRLRHKRVKMAPGGESTKIALLNLAHQQRSPARREGAAVRILGVFPNVDSLRRHAERFYADHGLDLVAAPISKWVAVLQQTENGSAEIGHLERLGRAYKAREKRHEEEFRENVSSQKTGEVRRDREACAPSVAEPAAGSEERVEAPCVPRDAELRLQRYAVISILPDVDEDDARLQQPALLVWDAFDTEEEARERIKTELSMMARDVHLDTVTMYEWIPLTGLDLSKIKEEFRDESLTDIMQARKDEGRQVEQYKTLCEQRGQAPNVLELSECAPQGTPVLPTPLEDQTALPNLALEGSFEESAPSGS